MGDPVSMAVIGGAGVAMNAFGTANQYEAQSANAAYQAQVAQNNAAIAKQNAALETETGEIDAANREMKARAQVGAIKAGQSASGVDVNSGSFVQTRQTAAKFGMLDALTIRSNAAKKAWSDQVQSSNFTAQAGLERQESDQAASAAPVAAVGSLLSGGSTVAGNYMKLSAAMG